jgi:hypothetical protein
MLDQICCFSTEYEEVLAKQVPEDELIGEQLGILQMTSLDFN